MGRLDVNSLAPDKPQCLPAVHNLKNFIHSTVTILLHGSNLSCLEFNPSMDNEYFTAG